MLTQLKEILHSRFPKQFLKQDKQYKNLQVLLNSYLKQTDPGLIGHVSISHVRNKHLLLTAHSPVWANRLRYLTDGILQYLSSSQEQVHLHDIQIRVVNLPIEQSEPPKKTSSKPTISDSSAHIIESAAESISDPDLKDRLKRLAAMGKK